jgi:hypothetical protein
MFARKCVFVCALLICLSSAAHAQALSDVTIVPLVVDAGFPLQVVLTNKLRFEEGERVHAELAESVYAFNREVIPSGSEVIGTVTGFRETGKRILRMLRGNFTPAREPQLTFHTLMLPGGTRISVTTSIVGVKAGDSKSSKKERIKDALWSLSPYRPQYVPPGVQLKVVLGGPLRFGEAVLKTEALGKLGAELPSGVIASVRLTTELDSRSAMPGDPVEAKLIRPLFSPDEELIYPVNSTLRGEVFEVKSARMWHRNGRMGFRFTTIELPPILRAEAPPVQVSGDFAAADVADQKELGIDKNGAIRIHESKKRFIAPAYAFIKAGTALNASSDSFGQAVTGAYSSRMLKQFSGQDSGLGLTGSISGAMIPPVGIGLAFYGAARSVYSNFIGRGRDVKFPVDTFMEIRLENPAQ